MQDRIKEYLMQFDLEKLHHIQTWIELQVEARRSAKQHTRVFIPKGNLEELAADAGLDISGLIRASKHY